MPPQSSSLINTAYFDSLADDISSVPSRQELTTLAERAMASLVAQQTATMAQMVNLAPLAALLNPPTSPDQVVTWAKNFVTNVLAPQYKPYLNYIQQVEQLQQSAQRIASAIQAAEARFASCGVAVPNLTAFPLDPSIGQQFFDTATNSFVQWNGSDWEPSPTVAALPYSNAVSWQAAWDTANAAVAASANVATIEANIADLQANASQLFASAADTSALLEQLIVANAAVATDVANLAVTVDDNNAFAVDQFATFTDTTTALAGEFLTLQTNVGNSIASVNSNTVALSNTVNSLAGQLTTYQAQFSNSIASVNSNVSVLSNSVSAISATQTQLQANVANNASSINAESITRANAVASLSAEITTLQSNVAGANATISSNFATFTAANNALSSQVQTLNANVANVSATVSQNSGAIATLQGRTSAWWNVTATAPGGTALVSLNADNHGTNVQIVANTVNFGPNAFFDETTNTLQWVNGGYRRVDGAGFGANSNLLLAYASANTIVNAITKTNSVLALSTDGNLYYQGAAIGQLATSTLTPTHVTNANVPAGGANRVMFSQFEKGLTGWINNDTSGLTITNTTGTQNGIAYIQASCTATAAGQAISLKAIPFPVVAGENLAFSYGVATSNCTAIFNFIFFDKNGAVIQQPGFTTASNNTAFNTPQSGTYVVPANAVTGWFIVYAHSVAAGAMSFSVTYPMACGIAAGQTAVPSFSRGPNSADGADVTGSFPLPGANRLALSLFEKGAASNGNGAPWNYSVGGSATSPSFSTYGSNQNVYGRVAATSSASGQWTNLFQYFPCTGGETISAQAVVSLTGPCTGEIAINWNDASGSFISQSLAVANIPANSTAYLAQGFVTAPSNAVGAQFYIQANSTGAGTITIAAAQPMVCSAIPGQTGVPTFTPGPNSVPGSDITSQNTAAAITGQGALATKGSVAWNSSYITGTPSNLLALNGTEGINNARLIGSTNNRIPYSNFEAGLTGWGIRYNPNNIVQSGYPTTGTYNGMNFLKSVVTVTAAGQQWSLGSGFNSPYTFPVIAGERLCVQAKLEMQVPSGGSVNFSAVLWWYDINGNNLGNGTWASGSAVPGVTYGTLFYGFITAPANAVSAGLEIYMYPLTSSGQYELAIAQPMVSSATQDQTLPPPFVASWAHPITSKFVNLATGRLINSYVASNPILTGATLTQTPYSPITSSLATGNASANISVASFTLQGAGVGPITYNPSTLTGMAFSTTYYMYAYDPNLQGGSPSIVASTTTSNYNNNANYLYIGAVTTVTSTGGTSSGGGGGGGGGCVSADAWLPTYKRAGDAKVGDDILLLSDDGEGVYPAKISGMGTGPNEAVLMTTASGITLTLSGETPVTLRDGSHVEAWDILGHDVAVLDEQGFRWEEVVALEHVGSKLVAHISVGGRVYAAGDQRGRYIFTHNAYKP